VRHAFAHKHQERYGIGRLCRVLGLFCSGYYAWKKALGTRRRHRREALTEAIRRVYLESRRSYGNPRVHKALVAGGVSCSRKQIARLMQRAGLRGKTRRRYRVLTTDSAHRHDAASNHLDRRFKQSRANCVWAGDITYVATAQGWLFVAVVLDLFSRRVIGWSFGVTLHGTLATEALQMAIDRRDPPPGVMVHSDRGVQYACGGYRRLLEKHHMVASMSRRGNPLDNAVAESFFKTLKAELIDERAFATRQQARGAIFEYLETFYNARRLHSALGHQSPEDFEAATLCAQTKARP
jgi:transposase InsO family protein